MNKIQIQGVKMNKIQIQGVQMNNPSNEDAAENFENLTLIDPLYDCMDCNDFEEVKLKFDICNSPSKSARGMDCGVSSLRDIVDLFWLL